MNVKSNPWGYHTIFDCSSCNKKIITNKGYIVSFIKTIVQQIDMVAYGDPLIEHFATHDPDKAGFSFCQMIETSNITGHFVDKTGDAYIDIFSCKEYDVDKAESCIKFWFGPQKIKRRLFERKA